MAAIECHTKVRGITKKLEPHQLCDGLRDCPKGEDEGSLGNCVPSGEPSNNNCCETLIVDGRSFAREKYERNNRDVYQSIDNKDLVIFFANDAWYYTVSGKPMTDDFRKNPKFTFKAVNRKNEICPPIGQWLGRGDHSHRPIFVFCQSAANNQTSPLISKGFRSSAVTTFEDITESKPIKLRTCGQGRANQVITTGIVGGSAVKDKYSWSMAAYLQFQKQNNKYNCGGTIISDYHIITAAHCCDDMDSVEAFFGNNDRRNSQFTMVATRTDWTIHHKYFDDSDGSAYNFDICVIKMKQDIFKKSKKDCKTSNCVSRACLPSAPPVPGKACWIAGWGTTGTGEEAQMNLREAGINIFSTNYCRSATKYSASAIKFDQICAGVPDTDDGLTDGGVDTCQGDSGGPLICEVNGQAVLTGITSWGGGDCAEEGYSGVYGNTFSYLGWINTLIAMPEAIGNRFI